MPMAPVERDELTTDFQSNGSDLSALPDPPIELHDAREAGHVLRILQSLHDTSADLFAKVFCSPEGSEARKWDEYVSEINHLLELRILCRSDDDRLRSAYLIMPWAGAFYLSDFPGREHPLEVFSPHVETRFFAKLLQVHPEDKVLDLGTGSGILLLEAARHGATGVGIDISDRAITFARANAALNGLSEQRVRFQRGDITNPDVYRDLDNPNIVLCNPPFEPVPDDPGFPKRPLHSHGGPYGTDVFNKLLAALTRWPHQSRLFQLVSFSMGRSTNGRPGRGEHLLVTDQLRTTATELGAVLDLSELLRPFSLSEYLVLNFEGGPHAAGSQWLSRMKAEGFAKLHLLFANLYVSRSSGSRSDRLIRWTPHENNPLEDECFLWPLASPKRRFSGCYEVSESDLYERHLEALTAARETKITAEEMDLRLNDRDVQEYLERLLRDDSLFGETVPLLVVDLRKDPAGSPLIEGVLKLASEGTTWFTVSDFTELKSLTTELFGDRIGVAACTVLPGPPFLRPSIDAGELSQVLVASAKLPKDAVQRFFAISSPEICLSPPRQRIFLSVLSELAVRAKVLAHQRAVELADIVRSQLDGLLHTALNTLRSIQADVACQDFGNGVPPQSLSCNLVTQDDKGPTSQMLEQRFLETLNRIWTGEKAAAGALSFARILAGDGRIQDKQKATQSYNLLTAAKRAELILKGYATGDPDRKYEVTRDDTSLQRVRFPAGYLQMDLLAIVIYELLLNGYRHATAKPIRLLITARPHERGISLTIRSELSERESSRSLWEKRDGITLRVGEWEQDEQRGKARDSFLFRFQNVSTALKKGLEITTDVVQGDSRLWYEASLSCGLLTEQSGTSVQPAWVEETP